MKPTKKIIALSGGIGSGKSYAGRLLSSLGYAVIDADTISRELTGGGNRGVEAVLSAFGDAYSDGQGGLLRKKLAETVFNDAEKLSLLNAVLHPLILEELEMLTEELTAEAVFVEIPLLAAGSPYAKLFDEVWALSADEKIRVKRAAERDGISESDVALRMKNQPSDAEREEIADTVIRSDLGSAEFERQIYDGLKKSIGRRIK